MNYGEYQAQILRHLKAYSRAKFLLFHYFLWNKLKVLEEDYDEIFYFSTVLEIILPENREYCGGSRPVIDVHFTSLLKEIALGYIDIDFGPVACAIDCAFDVIDMESEQDFDDLQCRLNLAVPDRELSDLWLRIDTLIAEREEDYEDIYFEDLYPHYYDFDTGWDWIIDAIPSSMVTQMPKAAPRKKPKRKDPHKRHIPNYVYQPKGEIDKYYQKKIKELTSWRVENVNHVNYALRVFEGWLGQADKFAARARKGDGDYFQRLAFSIADNIIWFFPSYYAHECLAFFEKQHPRMKKMLKHARRVLMENIPAQKDTLDWFVGNAEKLHGYSIYDNGTFLDLNSLIAEVKALVTH